MQVLSEIHGFLFGNPLAPHPLGLASLLLTVAAVVHIFWPRLRALVLGLLRLNWLAYAVPVISGTILFASGRRTPSATEYEGGLTRYGCPPDPARAWEHLMYAGFVLLSLLAMEALLRRGYLEPLGITEGRARLLVPVVALFMYGCAYMVGRVAILPGSALIGECVR